MQLPRHSRHRLHFGPWQLLHHSSEVLQVGEILMPQAYLSEIQEEFLKLLDFDMESPVDCPIFSSLVASDP